MKFLSLFILLLVSEISGASEKTIYLRRGEAHRLYGGAGLYVENANIVKAKELQSGYNLIGQKLGNTNVRHGDKKYRVSILHTYDYDYYKSLERAIKDMRGPTLRFNGTCSLIEGRILLWQDYLDIIKSVLSKRNQNCKNSFIMQARFDLEGEDLSDKIKEAFQSANLETPEYDYEPHLVFHINKKDLADYEDFFSKYGFVYSAASNHLAVTPNIETEIFVMEIRKSELMHLGLNWPSHVNLEGKKLLLDESTLSASVHAIEESGKGKVLASPKIVTANGKEGDFLAGGEIPIRASGYQFSKVVWKTYGISLKVKPASDTKGNIYLDLEIEVSMPDESTKIEGIPGFLKNKMSSQFFIRDQEYLILSGLIKEDQSESLRGFPALSRLPVLGLLFGSESYRKQKSELVIMVKPKIQRL